MTIEGAARAVPTEEACKGEKEREGLWEGEVMLRGDRVDIYVCVHKNQKKRTRERVDVEVGVALVEVGVTHSPRRCQDDPSPAAGPCLDAVAKPGPCPCAVRNPTPFSPPVGRVPYPVPPPSLLSRPSKWGVVGVFSRPPLLHRR